MAAQRLCADAVEIDVRMDASKVIVLAHDRTFWRVAHSPLPVRLTPASLRQRLRLSNAEAPATLRGAVAALPDGLGLIVEAKESRVVRPAIELLQDAGVLDRVGLWVRSVQEIDLCAELAPPCERALLDDTRDGPATLAYISRAAASGATAISIHQDVISARLVDRAHAAGLTVYCWVVREGDHPRAVEADADGIVTDWPVRARQVAEA